MKHKTTGLVPVYCRARVQSMCKPWSDRYGSLAIGSTTSICTARVVPRRAPQAEVKPHRLQTSLRPGDVDDPQRRGLDPGRVTRRRLRDRCRKADRDQERRTSGAELARSIHVRYIDPLEIPQTGYVRDPVNFPQDQRTRALKSAVKTAAPLLPRNRPVARPMPT